MAVKYVRRQSDTSANAFKASSVAAGLMVDSDDNKLKLNPNGTVRDVVDTVGDFTLTGTISGMRQSTAIVTGDTTLTSADSGKVLIDTKGSATTTFTLPAGSAGMNFTFVCGDASGEIIIEPAGAEQIFGKTHAANDGVALASTATTGVVKNTAATNVKGDMCRIVHDGTQWWIVAQTGVWSAT